MPLLRLREMPTPTCSRLLASLHGVMPSHADADGSKFKHHQTLSAHVMDHFDHNLDIIVMKITKHFWNLCDGLMFAVFLCLQMQKAHDFICELELNPSTSASTESLEFSKELKSKRRSEQILSRTENDYDQLGSSGEANSVPNGVAQLQTGSSAVVDFSDVSLDWGLGKLVSKMPMSRGILT